MPTPLVRALCALSLCTIKRATAYRKADTFDIPTSGRCAFLGIEVTDTGGSIRLPSSYCGIVGMKPTYGRVSTYGVVPLAWSLDHVGPMTRTVPDNALMLTAIAGPDKMDSTCSRKSVPAFSRQLSAGVEGVRIGIPSNYFMDYASKEVVTAVQGAANVLASHGATISDVEMPHFKYALGAELAILFAEALSYHSKYLRQKKLDLYTKSNRVHLDVARFISASDYIQAQRVRRLIIQDFEKAFECVDVILTPSTGVQPHLVEEDDWVDQIPMREVAAGTTPLHEILWRMPVPGNLAGVPALALPCGFSSEGLPLGLQIFGRHWQEDMVYRIGAAYETATQRNGWRRPPLEVECKRPGIPP